MASAPPSPGVDDAAIVPTRYWHRVEDGRVQCDVCPRHCRLHDGQRGLCFDLKAFTETFYREVCAGHLAPVLETLEYLAHETNVWLEITNLMIPGLNDSEEETGALTRWVVDRLGPHVPIHFTAFHPDWKMRDVPATPRETLVRARAIARANGVRYAYTGNVHDVDGGTTACHECGTALIVRDGFELLAWRLTGDGRCERCGARCAGVFEGAPGRWGARRRSVRLRDAGLDVP